MLRIPNFESASPSTDWQRCGKLSRAEPVSHEKRRSQSSSLYSAFSPAMVSQHRPWAKGARDYRKIRTANAIRLSMTTRPTISGTAAIRPGLFVQATGLRSSISSSYYWHTGEPNRHPIVTAVRRLSRVTIASGRACGPEWSYNLKQPREVPIMMQPCPSRSAT